MTRLLLRALNAPTLILLVTFAIALQTSLFASWPLQYFQPDVVLIAVIWCGLRRPFAEGGIITLVISDIAEVHSAAPQGLFLILYMMVYLGVRAANQIMVIPNLASYVILTLFASIFWKFSNAGLLQAMGSTSQWKHTFFLLFPGAVVEGALSIFAYRWLDRFDWLTYQVAHSDRTIEQELLQLDVEDF